MPQFLTISPTDVDSKRPYAWDNFRRGEYIALGWYHTDYTGKSLAQITEHLRSENFPNVNAAIDAHKKLLALEVGDIVAVNNVNHGIFGIGRVRSGYKFKERIHDTGHDDPAQFYSHYREVEWLRTEYMPKATLLQASEKEWAPRGTLGALEKQLPAWVIRALEAAREDKPSTPTIDESAFEEAYDDFLYRAAQVSDGKPFTDFDHPMVSPSESYKKEVYTDARNKLLTKFWKLEDIGSSRIHKAVIGALHTTVVHKGERIDNNLLDWRLKDDFVKLAKTAALETVLFDLYKNKRADEECFDALLDLGQKYQFIAYLFFLKDKERYLPISQEGFDNSFELFGVKGFKTSGNASWANYSTFIGLIKQVQRLLRSRLTTPVELLDAHSFAWCIGHTFPKWDDEPDEDKDEDQDDDGEVGLNVESLSSEEVDIKDFHDELAFPEGKESWILHRKSERNPEVVRIAKERFKSQDPLMRCQVCAFSFAARYGEQGIGYIEAHHVLPVSEMPPEHHTKPEDLVMVCSNCHVMLHRKRPWLRHEALKHLLIA